MLEYIFNKSEHPDHGFNKQIKISIFHKGKLTCKTSYRTFDHPYVTGPKSKFSLCTALILCHLDYSSSSWYSGLSKTLKRKLQICQNKVRFILDLSPMHSVNSTVFDTLNMLNVDRRVKQMRLNHVF